MTVPLPTQTEHEQRHDLVRDLALVSYNFLSLDDVAAKHGIEASELPALLANPRLASAVEREAVELRQNGAVVEGRAADLLHCALTALEDAVRAEDISVTSLVKIAEVALRISGIADRRAAEIKQPVAAVHLNVRKTITFIDPRARTKIIDGKAVRIEPAMGAVAPASERVVTTAAGDALQDTQVGAVV